MSSPNSRISHPKSTVDPISPLRSTNQQKISSKQMHSPKTSMSEILAESDDHLVCSLSCFGGDNYFVSNLE